LIYLRSGCVPPSYSDDLPKHALASARAYTITASSWTRRLHGNRPPKELQVPTTDAVGCHLTTYNRARRRVSKAVYNKGMPSGGPEVVKHVHSVCLRPYLASCIGYNKYLSIVPRARALRYYQHISDSSERPNIASASAFHPTASFTRSASYDRVPNSGATTHSSLLAAVAPVAAVAAVIIVTALRPRIRLVPVEHCCNRGHNSNDLQLPVSCYV